MESKSIKVLYEIGFGLILIVSSIPLACGYIMEGGDVMLWIHRIEELKEGFANGNFMFFPTIDLIRQDGGWYSALNSNVWLLFPALMCLVGLSMTTVWRLYLLILNIATIFSLRCFFKQWLKNDLATIFAVLLYMTSPYRVYICYDKANLESVIAWVFIPLALSGMLCIYQKQAKVKEFLITAIAFAAIGYADLILFLITIFLSLLGIIWYRNWKGLIPVFLGGLIYLPGTIYWIKYLFSDYFAELGFPLNTISQEGYALGQFFTSWVYKADCPGLGLGLLLGLFVLGWLIFIEGADNILKKNGFFVCIMLSMTVLSSHIFPWDIVQRVSVFLLKLIALMETPGMFFSFATLMASGLVAQAVRHLSEKEEKFVKIGFAVIIAFAAVGVCVYTCNTLTYSRIPMFL